MKPDELRGETRPDLANAAQLFPALSLDFDVAVNSLKTGLLPGRLIKINKSSAVVVLPLQLDVGENVMLEVKTPSGRLNGRGKVRDREAFHHTFELSRFPLTEDAVDYISRAVKERAQATMAFNQDR